MNAGIYHLEKKVLKDLPKKGDIEKTVFPDYAKKGILNTIKFKNIRWHSIDSFKDIEECSLHGHSFGFRLTNEKACKHLWKWEVGHPTILRCANTHLDTKENDVASRLLEQCPKRGRERDQPSP